MSEYGAKVVMPIDAQEPGRVGEVRERAQKELQAAEAFLKSTYGRQP